MSEKDLNNDDNINKETVDVSQSEKEFNQNLLYFDNEFNQAAMPKHPVKPQKPSSTIGKNNRIIFFSTWITAFCF